MAPSDVQAVYSFEYRGKRFAVRLLAEGVLELCLDGIVRKRRQPRGKQPMYLWTNVELQWEEHHFVEARYWPNSGRLLVTANGHTIHDGQSLAVASV